MSYTILYTQARQNLESKFEDDGDMTIKMDARCDACGHEWRTHFKTHGGVQGCVNTYTRYLYNPVTMEPNDPTPCSCRGFAVHLEK